ncbi:MAG TPA: toll/interleukin-1 receptor domain-containing protein [Desulfatiglandales bacterium]|nr:toll/interleukin-1 receptor domain-containing protein [Desulfatiglandales bacterium]
MGADPIVYCLQQLTDYDQFERLCNDLMSAEGYKNLEPLGGRGDKGRDAIRICRTDPDDITIFAYSVREDWRRKLQQDADRIKKVGHKLNRLVFSCTAHYNATERDEAIEFIRKNYEWTLELYGIERIRTLLSTVHERIITKHPHIFARPFFPRAGGQPLSFSPDLIIVDFSKSDETLASWLARKLKLHGYLVWCRSIDPVGGESVNDTTEALLEQRAAFCVSVLSQPAISDSDLSYRRAAAIRTGRKKNAPFLIPVVAQPIFDDTLDANTKALQKISFVDSWQSGLNQLIAVFEAGNCPKAEGGKHFVLNSFFADDVVVDQEETVISNMFQVLKIPETIHRFESLSGIPSSSKGEVASRWAFRQVNPTTFLSFHLPPEEDAREFKLSKKGGALWSCTNAIDGIYIKNLIPELIKKSLVVACQKKGLQFCTNSYLPYFPPGLLSNDRFYFDFFNDSKTFIKVSGERKYYRPGASERFRYYLSPNFYVSERSSGTYAVIVHVHIRLTDLSGKCLEGQKVISRRKRLCKDWFNDDWAKKVTGIMRFIGEDGKIVIGDSDKDIIVINSRPCMWAVPLSINEKALTYESVAIDEALMESSDSDEE